MASGRIGTILLGFALLLTLSGCESGKLAKEIASQRKTGDAAGARQKALDALAIDPDQMLVWRELAYCDEVLGRDPGFTDEARVGYLLEGALIVAAVCADHKGSPPDDRWGAVSTMLAGDMQTSIVAVLGGVKAHYRREARHSARGVPRELKDEFDERPTSRSTYDEWYESDPEQVAAATRLYSRLKPLSLRLPAAKGGEAAADPLTELGKWAVERNLHAASLTSLYQEGETAVTKAYTLALEDLQEQGHFQLSSIVQNSLLAH